MRSLPAVALCLGVVPVFAQPDPLINEFVANHAGPDVNEFVELFGAPEADYAAFTILEVEGDAGGSLGVIDGAFPAGPTDAAGYWTTGFLNAALENGTLTLLLVQGFTGQRGVDLDGDDDGTVDPDPPWLRLADAVAVDDGDAGDRTYADAVLSPAFDGGQTTPGGASRLPNGRNTGTADDWMRNHFEGDGLPAFPDAPMAPTGAAVNTPGVPNQAGHTPPPPPPPSGLRINEVDADTPGADTREFIELYDGGRGATPLEHLVVVLFNGSTDGSYRAFDLDGFHTDANGFFVLGSRDLSPPPGLVIPDATLQNGADAVALFAGDAGDFPGGTPVTATYLVDALVYDTDDDDDPGLLALLHPRQPQVNENETRAGEETSMQRLPNGDGGVRSTETYAAFPPTPGAVNGGADLELKVYVANLDREGATTTATLALRLTNRGPAEAGSILVAVTLAEAAEVLDAAASSGAYDPHENLWSIAALPVGDTASLDLTVSAPTGRRLLYRAEVVESSVPDPDSQPADAAGDDDGILAFGHRPPAPGRFQADLSLAVTAAPSRLSVGGSAALTFHLANDGPAMTSGVEVTSLLPDGLRYVAHRGAGRFEPERGVWTVGRVPHDSVKTMILVVTATMPGTFTLSAEITASHLPDPDSYLANAHPGEDDRSDVAVDVGDETAERPTPVRFELAANYPNPFNPVTAIPFTLAEAAYVRLAVYDVVGSEVASLVDGWRPAGRHVNYWDASAYPSGVYLVLLEVSGEIQGLLLTLTK